MVDLIGLRFSLQHLRLVGYGLLSVWLLEMGNLLSSPKLAEIGTRLHYTSQFLDLSPILLVAIGLIAFQGGLRRRPLEHAVLPLLLAFLPLLSAVHFFLAPVSVANVITLVQKQQQIGLDQIDRIDQQIDRATSILRESDSIDTLLESLQRIPGLQVRVPPNAKVNEARQEVRGSLERERDRLRERIESNLSSSREAFIRRAAINAALASLVGLLLWGLHHGAMREMEQAIPFLDWVLVQGEVPQQPEVLQELLQFQRACVALGWFSLLERCLRLVRRVVRRPSTEALAEEQEQEEQQQQWQGQGQANAEPPANPFTPAAPRRAGMRGEPLPLFSGPQPSLFPSAALEAPAEQGSGPGGPEAFAADPLGEHLKRSNAAAERREQRRRERDLERYRAQRRRIERDGLDPFAIFAAADPPADDPAAALDRDRFVPDGSAARLSPRQLRRLQREHQRAREALARMAHSDEMGRLLNGRVDPVAGESDPQLQHELSEELQLLRRQGELGLPPRRGLAGLWARLFRHF